MRNKTHSTDVVLFSDSSKHLSKPEIASFTISDIMPKINLTGRHYRNFWCILKDAKFLTFYQWLYGKYPDSADLPIKISELLKFDFSEENNHTKWTSDFKRFLFSLQVKLLELGFGEEDGVFMANEFHFKLE